MSSSIPKCKGPPAPRRDTSRGAAAVEFALVLPLFIVLVMGAVDYGYFFFSQQVVTNAAREGARAGTLVDPVARPPTSSAQSGAIAAAQAAAQAYMQGNGVACSTGGDSCITATYATIGGNAAVDVVVSYPTKSLTGFTGFALPSKVYARAVMRWQ